MSKVLLNLNRSVVNYILKIVTYHHFNITAYKTLYKEL